MEKLSLQDRLDCPHSYAKEDTPELQCDYSFCEKCDGTIWEHCLWDMSEEKKEEIYIREGKYDR